MKKTLSMLAFLFVGWLGSAHAQDQMLVTMNDGTAEQKYALVDVGKLFFDTENVFVTQKAAATNSIPLTSILSIKFVDSTVTGLRTHDTVEKNNLRIAIAADIITIYGWNSKEKTTAAIYAASGTMVWTDRKWNGNTISTQSLPKGVYILKINNQTFKFSK